MLDNERSAWNLSLCCLFNDHGSLLAQDLLQKVLQASKWILAFPFVIFGEYTSWYMRQTHPLWFLFNSLFWAVVTPSYQQALCHRLGHPWSLFGPSLSSSLFFLSSDERLIWPLAVAYLLLHLLIRAFCRAGRPSDFLSSVTFHAWTLSGKHDNAFEKFSRKKASFQPDIIHKMLSLGKGSGLWFRSF